MNLASAGAEAVAHGARTAVTVKATGAATKTTAITTGAVRAIFAWASHVDG